MKRRFDRAARVGDLIQKALAIIIQQDDMDSRFNLVTVLGVDVSRDLSYAKVHVSVLLDDTAKIKEVISALNRSAKSFRFALAKAVKLRVVPELRFAFDDSTQQGFHISNLIDAAVKKTEEKD
jgi:ribosome-binding factor A